MKYSKYDVRQISRYLVGDVWMGLNVNIRVKLKQIRQDEYQ